MARGDTTNTPQPNEGEIPAETQEAFAGRVEKETGVPLDAIPAGGRDDLLGGQIVARRGDVYVVTHGYPDDRDKSRADTWDPKPENFRVVDLSKEQK